MANGRLKVTMRLRLCLCILSTCTLLAGLTPEETVILASLRPDTLRGHVSFLASDALQGRDTPSAGLAIADEYIASQFRRFGLEPLVAGSYFQPVSLVRVTQQPDKVQATIELPGEMTWQCPTTGISLVTNTALELDKASTVKVTAGATLPSREAVAGKAILVHLSSMDRGAFNFLTKLRELDPAVIITNGRSPSRSTQLRLAGTPAQTPILFSSDPKLATVLAGLADGPSPARLTVAIPAPLEEPINVRNVVARLPGSDPTLKDQVVILSAHHDHLGIANRDDGDRIFNGANDDASGVASLLALAEAFATAPNRPRRSLVFASFTAEEKGLLGSEYYAAHPLIPLKDTVAHLSFEQLGRTDDHEEARVKKLSGTGLDYTTIFATLKEAGAATDVDIWKHERNNDLFFAASDNYPLAKAGVPAISLCVAFVYSDYHRPTDHWEKLDYDNMQAVLRTIALTTRRIADAPEAPRWLPDIPQTEKFRSRR